MHSKRCIPGKILWGAMLVLALLLLSACGSEESPDISKVNMNDVTLDVADMAESLLSELTFDDTLVPIEEDIAAALLDVADLYNSMAAYGSTGATAEMLVILRCESATDAETAAGRLETYRTEMAAVYADYNMKESEKLTGAMLECRGRYVVFCVSPDTEAVTAAYQAYVIDSAKQ